MDEINQVNIETMDYIIQKANKGCYDSQYMVVHSYGILDISDGNDDTEEHFKKLFELGKSEYPWLKKWYHHIFSFYNLKNSILIDLAEEGDSQARQMLSAAYFKGVYNFEQDFDKFKELCDLGWQEALEIQKKFFDVFDKSQTEKTN